MVHRRQQVNEPVAASSIMKELFSKALKVASRESSVLITGESGTGKEVLARYIHAHSSRSAKPMVVVNCGAIPESLIESELFGHVRGAFTGAIDSRVGYFEAAHQGTLFLDEIGELPLALQVKLLRALQDGCIQRVGDSKQTHVDVRVLVATHRNLEEAVSRGAFRQDLYFRLNVIPLSIPPLRQRPEDIRAMAEVFLNRYSPGHPLQLSQDAWDALLSYGYPGNVRELENAIEHACVLAEGPNIELGDLPERIQKQSPVSDFSPGAYPPVSQPAESSPLLTPAPGSCRTSPATLEAIEKKMISEALERARFNHTRAAGLLGITRRTLGYRIRKHGLDEFVDQGVAREREARRTLNDLT
jgi:two-component system response regulator PilR (NtrC family)